MINEKVNCLFKTSNISRLISITTTSSISAIRAIITTTTKMITDHQDIHQRQQEDRYPYHILHQSLSHSVSQPLRQPLGQPLHQPLHQPLGQPLGQPLSQPLAQPLLIWIFEMIKGFLSASECYLFSQPLI